LVFTASLLDVQHFKGLVWRQTGGTLSLVILHKQGGFKLWICE